jgi:hypothetical protein
MLVADKLKTIIHWGYLVPVSVRSLIQFFDVLKADDIRLVYNGRSCGLNQSTWAPNFWLHSTSTALRLLDFNYYSVDLDGRDVFKLSFTSDTPAILRSGRNPV